MKVQKDKIIHFGIGLISYLILFSLSSNHMFSLLITTILGWAIETWQRRTGRGQYDRKDAYAVMLGGATSCILLTLFNI